MGRPRTVGRYLPKGMYLTKGMYYFVGADKKWVRLGASIGLAMQKYHKLVVTLESPKNIVTLGELIDRYMAQVSQYKSMASYHSDISAAKNLRSTMGHLYPDDLTPDLVCEYIEHRSETAPVRVNREIALLSHIYTKGIRWRVAKFNPCSKLERNKERPRTRYVTDEEFENFKSFIPLRLNLYLELKYLTGLRQSDMLVLTFSAVKAEGLQVTLNKTLKRKHLTLLITWTPRLVNIINAFKILHKNDLNGKTIFTGAQGKPLSRSGFRSYWQRQMVKALAQNIITERFQERDIRAKTASDMGSLSDARLLLGHESDKTTAKYYSRLPQKVRPLQ